MSADHAIGDGRSLEKRSASRQTDTNPHATANTVSASLLRATALIAAATLLGLSGCSGPSHYFRWADEPNARIKANLSESDIVLVRNCVVKSLTPDNRSTENGLMTITNGGASYLACFITRDRTLVVVSPLNGPMPIRIKLTESLPWYAYRIRAPFRHAKGFWFRDASASTDSSDIFVSFREAAGDGDGSANNTVFNYLVNNLSLVPKEAPPIRVRFLFSAGYMQTEMILP